MTVEYTRNGVALHPHWQLEMHGISQSLLLLHVDVPLLGGLYIYRVLCVFGSCIHTRNRSIRTRIVFFGESLSKLICFEESILSSITRLQLYALGTGAVARLGEHAAVCTRYTSTGRFNLRILLVAVPADIISLSPPSSNTEYRGKLPANIQTFRSRSASRVRPPRPISGQRTKRWIVSGLTCSVALLSSCPPQCTRSTCVYLARKHDNPCG